MSCCRRNSRLVVSRPAISRPASWSVLFTSCIFSQAIFVKQRYTQTIVFNGVSEEDQIGNRNLTQYNRNILLVSIKYFLSTLIMVTVTKCCTVFYNVFLSSLTEHFFNC